jgi:hypothetical protein
MNVRELQARLNAGLFDAETARKRAICAGCEYYQTLACCNSTCPEARKDPARELNSCRFGKWDLAPETPDATREKTP